jgi:hypothetical protein
LKRFVFLTALLLVMACSKGNDPNQALFPIKKEGRWGFASRDGKIRIRPNYQMVYSFHDGRARVRIGDKEGFIDKSGKMIVPARYFQVNSFSDGLARVSPLWKKPSDSLVERFAGVSSPRPAVKEAIQFIDLDGRVALTLPADVPAATDFSERIAFVKNPYSWGMINAQGVRIIERVSAIESTFHEGRAVVAWGPDLDPRYGFADALGRHIIPPTFEDAKRFSEGLAPVKSEGFWGYIDLAGQWAIPARFREAQPFFEGLAAVLDGAGWTYIDRTGRITVDTRYDVVSRFSDGWAVIKDSNGWQTLSLKGERYPIPTPLVPADSENGFIDGLLAVRSGDAFGYITPQGDVAIKITH